MIAKTNEPQENKCVEINLSNESDNHGGKISRTLGVSMHQNQTKLQAIPKLQGFGLNRSSCLKNWNFTMGRFVSISSKQCGIITVW